MSTTTLPTSVPVPDEPLDAAAAAPARRRGVVHDAWVIARRGLTHMRRQPELLADAIGHPIMFVLMFGYVFGGAIDVPGGGSYREFLMGGVFAQITVFSAFFGALALATDRRNRAVDRFRSLPVANGAVLGGHALTNLLKSALALALTTLCGFAVGWRIDSGVLDAVGGYLILFGFSFAMIWVGILLGSVVSTPEGVSGLAFVVLFPLTFIASTFVPTDTMPSLLQTAADWNPTTTLADALRIQFGNPNPPALPGDPWSTSNPALYTIIWIVGVVVVCAPLAVRAHRRSLDS